MNPCDITDINCILQCSDAYDECIIKCPCIIADIGGECEDGCPCPNYECEVPIQVPTMLDILGAAYFCHME